MFTKMRLRRVTHRRQLLTCTENERGTGVAERKHDWRKTRRTLRGRRGRKKKPPRRGRGG